MSANPYGVATITETCICGARFDWQGDTWLGKCAVEKFRKDHHVFLIIESIRDFFSFVQQIAGKFKIH